MISDFFRCSFRVYKDAIELSLWRNKNYLFDKVRDILLFKKTGAIINLVSYPYTLANRTFFQICGL